MTCKIIVMRPVSSLKDYFHKLQDLQYVAYVEDEDDTLKVMGEKACTEAYNADREDGYEFPRAGYSVLGIVCTNGSYIPFLNGVHP